MRVVIQRVEEAELVVDNSIISSIQRGLIIYLGITQEDNTDDITWLTQKISNLRIFSDESGKMNLSVKDIGGEALVVSQFTLYASTKKGNRPSYLRSAKPEIAIPLYEEFVVTLRNSLPVQTGVFGADMQISYTNAGPVTIIIDSKNKE